jgi:type I restriction enzyme M protein
MHRPSRGFERCFGDDPNGRAKRSASDSPDDRWRSFTLDEAIERGYKIDSFKWLRDDELDDPDEILDPAELVTDAITELQAAVGELHELQKLLDVAEAVP